MSFRDNVRILIIISSFIFVSLFFFKFYREVWWDPAVYIAMGKYIYSFGNSGLWEASRPIIWPLFLGFLWKAGLNQVIFGKILELLFAVGCVYLTYLIARRIFDERIALISALFLAFSPAFFFFSRKILSDIPSLFFMLLSIYFFIDKKYFLTSLSAGISFLTRFLELFVFLTIFIIFLLYFKKEKFFLNNLFNISIGFLIIIIPYLIFNYFIYNNILYPFGLQLFLTKNTGWVFHEPFWFYFVNLFRENILLIFVIPGLIFIFKKPNYKKFTILFPFLTLFVFFTSISHKEVRFMLTFLPYLYIINSYGIYNILNKIKNKKLVFSFLLLIFLTWFIQTVYKVQYNYDQEKYNYDHEIGTKYVIFQDYLGKEYVESYNWITNPIFAIYSDKKIDELMYYPTFNHDKFLELKDNLDNARNVLINMCDLYCEPYNKFCMDDKNELINLLNDNFEILYYEKEKECESYIFRR